MNLTVLQENLLRALLRTGRIVSTKPQLPIIQNALLVAEKGRLRITTTNLETAESVFVGAKVEKEGGLCVSSRLLSELVSSLPQGATSLILKEGSLSVQSGGYHATIPGVSAVEFPPVATQTPKGGILLEKNDVVASIAQVIFAAATDEGRPLLTGVRILQREDETLFVATDGYRLSLKRLLLKTKEPLDLLVPARALGEVIKVCTEEKEVSQAQMAKAPDGQLVFVAGDTEITTRLIDGEYPNFEKIIPTRHNTRVLLDKETLLRAVKSAAIFARDSANIIRFHIENQSIIISANTPQVGENQVEIEGKVDGDGGDIAFNSRFLLEFLANFPGEELLFEMAGSLNPGVFKPVKDDSYLHIIMPVRVQS